MAQFVNPLTQDVTFSYGNEKVVVGPGKTITIPDKYAFAVKKSQSPLVPVEEYSAPPKSATLVARESNAAAKMKEAVEAKAAAEAAAKKAAEAETKAKAKAEAEARKADADGPIDAEAKAKAELEAKLAK